MHCHAELRLRVAVGGERHQAFDEIGRFDRNRERIPTELVWRGHYLGDRRAAHQPPDLWSVLERAACYGRTDAIEPGAAVRGARRRECRAAELLGIQSVRDLLRTELALRQRASNRLALVLVAESVEIPFRHELLRVRIFSRL